MSAYDRLEVAGQINLSAGDLRAAMALLNRIQQSPADALAIGSVALIERTVARLDDLATLFAKSARGAS